MIVVQMPLPSYADAGSAIPQMPYDQLCREAIAQALSGVHPEESGAFRRHKLKGIRPEEFSSRWLFDHEASKAIGPPFIDGGKNKWKDSTRITLNWSFGVYRRWALIVWCVRCGTNPKMKGGCLECAPLRMRVDRFVGQRFADTYWDDWRLQIAFDRTIAPICADWIDDLGRNGLPELAAILRNPKIQELPK